MNTDHESYTKRYFELIIEALKKETSGEFSTEEIRGEDLNVIEYHLKDCARRAVSSVLSTEGCLAIFGVRIRKLIIGDKDEWSHFKESIESNKRLFSQKALKQIKKLEAHFFLNKTPVAA